MRIAVHMLGVRIGGGRTYLRQLLRYLAATRQPHEFLILAAPGFEEDWASMVGSEKHAVRFITRSVPPSSRIVFDQIELPGLLRQERCDILWCPNNYACLRSPVPQLLMAFNPVFFSRRYGGLMHRYGSVAERMDYLFRRVHARRSVRCADVTLFPTAAFMDHVLNDLGAGAVRQPRALHPGLDTSVFDDADASHAPNGRAADGVVRLLYPTSWAPHKNFDLLFDAMEVLHHEGFPFELWLTLPSDEGPYRGPYGRWAESDFSHVRLVGPMIRRVGYLSPSEMAGRYAAADVIVFPSWLETFGYPLVEAQVSGRPLVASDTPTNREVAGDYARYHPPFEARALAAAIVEATRRPEYRPRPATVTPWSRHFAELSRLMETMA